jgi:hypothetical protein
VSALQQLTGLQHLNVREELVQCDGDTWLMPLTALTYLRVKSIHAVKQPAGTGWWCLSRKQQRLHLMQEHHAMAQRVIGLLQLQLQPWPVGLQQLVFWGCHCLVNDSFKPIWWQFTPPAPGSMQVTAWVEMSCV